MSNSHSFVRTHLWYNNQLKFFLSFWLIVIEKKMHVSVVHILIHFKPLATKLNMKFSKIKNHPQKYWKVFFMSKFDYPYHVTHARLSEFALYICQNVKEPLARNKWLQRIRTYDHLILKWTLSHSSKLGSILYKSILSLKSLLNLLQ